jgi:hypothetical protein
LFNNTFPNKLVELPNLATDLIDRVLEIVVKSKTLKLLPILDCERIEILEPQWK